jgi:hypothetical protein
VSIINQTNVFPESCHSIFKPTTSDLVKINVGTNLKLQGSQPTQCRLSVTDRASSTPLSSIHSRKSLQMRSVCSRILPRPLPPSRAGWMSNSLAAIAYGDALHAQTQLNTLAMNSYMKELDDQVMLPSNISSRRCHVWCSLTTRSGGISPKYGVRNSLSELTRFAYRHPGLGTRYRNPLLEKFMEAVTEIEDVAIKFMLVQKIYRLWERSDAFQLESLMLSQLNADNLMPPLRSSLLAYHGTYLGKREAELK